MALSTYVGVAWLLYWRFEVHRCPNALSQLGFWFGISALWLEAWRALLQL
jgi:hypothetical protein